MILAELQQRLEGLRCELRTKDAMQVGILVDRIIAWKADATTPRELLASLTRCLGGLWFSSDDVHRSVHEAIESFRPTVESLGGMTMNERLVMFDLIDLWDGSGEEIRDTLYSKLEAKTG
jgi:hypothetical protein